MGAVLTSPRPFSFCQQAQQYAVPTKLSRTMSYCAFVTDTEGDLEYFRRYVNYSKAISYKNESEDLLQVEEGWTFVFGGDVCDKGLGDIRIVKQLLQLKRDFPEQVVLIVGNRDVNKLRLKTELSDAAISSVSATEDDQYPYWVDERKRVTYQQFLSDPKEGLRDCANNAANRLRWILKHTMGSPEAFENRRQELSQIRNAQCSNITDDDVVQSYRTQIVPRRPDHDVDNFHLQYLQLAQLAHIHQSTLFIHGAVSDLSIGTVPGYKTVVPDAHEWVRKLNCWYQEELSSYCEDPNESWEGEGKRSSRTADKLMDYGLPGGNGGKTVVYDSYLSKCGNGAHLSPSVVKYLKDSNVNSVLSGHQPQGDCPNIMLSDGIYVLTADTSFRRWELSKSNNAESDSTGMIVDVTVLGDHAISVKGCLDDGKTKFGYKVRLDSRTCEISEPDCDDLIGQQLEHDGFWVKAKLVDGCNPEYLLNKGVGFKMVSEYASRKEVEYALLSRVGIEEARTKVTPDSV